MAVAPSSEQVVLVGEPVVVQPRDALVEVVAAAGVEVSVTVGAGAGGGGGGDGAGGGAEPLSTTEPKSCVQYQ